MVKLIKWWKAYIMADETLRFQMQLAKLMKKHDVSVFCRDSRIGFQREVNHKHITTLTRRNYIQYFDLDTIIIDQQRNPNCYLIEKEL
ncbi:hypothetical protein OTK49_03445 [Vibrio coralliirubri]|uniref:hypothetical protein n=1 Tax=Vibrio coralliirubri TaxID=1516159 RepID=UPI00228507EC|nr:hypothetical protein [Vibrio coralliirubri]MCY9861572.1 hypothetical protein [Vibrio coralliirubri]